MATMNAAAVIIFCVAVLVSLQAVQVDAYGTVVEYDWTISYIFDAPDCFERRLIGINGEYPGPDIEVYEGDTVRVRVKNELGTEATSIHWHGILQRGTPWMDGVPYESQCPILPGATFVYEFSTRGQKGTYWYHSHLGLQKKDGLYGLIKVKSRHPAPFAYDDEATPLLLNDWWHADSITQATGLDQRLPQPFRFVGAAQAFLINGQGRFNCSSVCATLPCNVTDARCGYPVITVKPNKVYRMRVVGVAGLYMMSLGVQGHPLTIVEADGTYTKPVVVDYLDVNAGQTYSVLFKTDKAVGNYWVTVAPRYRAGPSTYAFIHYEGAPVPDQFSAPPNYTGPANFDIPFGVSQAQSIRTHDSERKNLPALKGKRTIWMLGTQNRVEGRLRWAVNNHSFVSTDTPTLAATYYGLYTATDTKKFDKPPAIWNFSTPWPAGQSIEAMGAPLEFKVKRKETVLLVIQNTLALNNVSEQHPWHLHGHEFWVVGYGTGNYDDSKDRASFNLKDPIYRNMATVYPYGWTAIFIKFTNPGFWSFHCHIAFHLEMGMRAAFLVAPEAIPAPPKNFPICGKVTPSVVVTKKP